MQRVALITQQFRADRVFLSRVRRVRQMNRRLD
jgi:hypothetical protein